MDIGYQSASRLAMLKKRVKRCVCKFCGHPLHLRRILFSEFEDARIEIFCEHCGRIEFGVEREIYASARYFVEEMGFNYYPDLDENAQTLQMNIAKVCEIMAWENQNLGILNQEGFCLTLPRSLHSLGECIVLEDEDLREDEEEIDWESLKEVRFDWGL